MADHTIGLRFDEATTDLCRRIRAAAENPGSGELTTIREQLVRDWNKHSGLVVAFSDFTSDIQDTLPQEERQSWQNFFNNAIEEWKSLRRRQTQSDYEETHRRNIHMRLGMTWSAEVVDHYGWGLLRRTKMKHLANCAKNWRRWDDFTRVANVVLLLRHSAAVTVAQPHCPPSSKDLIGAELKLKVTDLQAINLIAEGPQWVYGRRVSRNDDYAHDLEQWTTNLDGSFATSGRLGPGKLLTFSDQRRNTTRPLNQWRPKDFEQFLLEIDEYGLLRQRLTLPVRTLTPSGPYGIVSPPPSGPRMQLRSARANNTTAETSPSSSRRTGDSAASTSTLSFPRGVSSPGSTDFDGSTQIGSLSPKVIPMPESPHTPRPVSIRLSNGSSTGSNLFVSNPNTADHESHGHGGFNDPEDNPFVASVQRSSDTAAEEPFEDVLRRALLSSPNAAPASLNHPAAVIDERDVIHSAPCDATTSPSGHRSAQESEGSVSDGTCAGVELSPVGMPDSDDDSQLTPSDWSVGSVSDDPDELSDLLARTPSLSSEGDFDPADDASSPSTAAPHSPLRPSSPIIAGVTAGEITSIPVRPAAKAPVRPLSDLASLGRVEEASCALTAALRPLGGARFDDTFFNDPIDGLRPNDGRLPFYLGGLAPQGPLDLNLGAPAIHKDFGGNFFPLDVDHGIAPAPSPIWNAAGAQISQPSPIDLSTYRIQRAAEEASASSLSRARWEWLRNAHRAVTRVRPDVASPQGGVAMPAADTPPDVDACTAGQFERAVEHGSSWDRPVLIREDPAGSAAPTAKRWCDGMRERLGTTRLRVRRTESPEEERMHVAEFLRLFASDAEPVCTLGLRDVLAAQLPAIAYCPRLQLLDTSLARGFRVAHPSDCAVTRDPSPQCPVVHHFGTTASFRGPHIGAFGDRLVKVLSGEVVFIFVPASDMRDHWREFERLGARWSPGGEQRALSLRAGDQLFVPAWIVGAYHVASPCVYMEVPVWDRLQASRSLGSTSWAAAHPQCADEPSIRDVLPALDGLEELYHEGLVADGTVGGFDRGERPGVEKAIRALRRCVRPTLQSPVPLRQRRQAMSPASEPRGAMRQKRARLC